MARATHFLLASLAWLVCLGMAAQGNSLRFGRTLVVDQSDGLLTVPAGKTWKIVNLMNTTGQITATGAISGHCGTSCGGGSCSSSSCRYQAFLFEVNGIGLNEVFGCFVCSGGNCNSGTGNCPPTHSFSVTATASLNTPFWLEAGNTLEVNVSNMLVSILEFDIVP